MSTTHLSNYPCLNTPDAPWNAPNAGACEYDHPVGEECEGTEQDECLHCETKCCAAAFVERQYRCCEECAERYFMVPKDVTAYLNRVKNHEMNRPGLSIDEFLALGEVFGSCMARIIAEQQEKRRADEEAILNFARVA